MTDENTNQENLQPVEMRDSLLFGRKQACWEARIDV